MKIIDNDNKETAKRPSQSSVVAQENPQPQRTQQPQRFDPATGAPIYPQAQVQATGAVTYDPATGAPIYAQSPPNPTVRYNQQTGAPIYTQTLMGASQQYDSQTGEIVYNQPAATPKYFDQQTGAPVYSPANQTQSPTVQLDAHVFSQQPQMVEQAVIVSEPVYDNEPRSIEQWPQVFNDKLDAEQEAAELAKKASEDAEKAAEKAAEKEAKKGKRKRKKGEEVPVVEGEEKEEKTPLTPKEKALEDLQKFIGSAFLAVLAIWVCFTFVFGVFVMSGESMYPKINDGDLVLYYRLSSEYYIDDVLTFELNGTRYTSRYIAMAGDVVDITSDGQLKINGSIQSEEIFYATYDLDTGITYPYTVPDGCVFVLCDYRTSSVDSRVFGAVSLDDIDGKVITILRRRSV